MLAILAFITILQGICVIILNRSIEKIGKKRDYIEQPDRATKNHISKQKEIGYLCVMLSLIGLTMSWAGKVTNKYWYVGLYSLNLYIFILYMYISHTVKKLTKKYTPIHQISTWIFWALLIINLSVLFRIYNRWRRQKKEERLRQEKEEKKKRQMEEERLRQEEEQKRGQMEQEPLYSRLNPLKYGLSVIQSLSTPRWTPNPIIPRLQEAITLVKSLSKDRYATNPWSHGVPTIDMMTYIQKLEYGLGIAKQFPVIDQYVKLILNEINSYKSKEQGTLNPSKIKSSLDKIINTLEAELRKYPKTEIEEEIMFAINEINKYDEEHETDVDAYINKGKDGWTPEYKALLIKLRDVCNSLPVTLDAEIERLNKYSKATNLGFIYSIWKRQLGEGKHHVIIKNIQEKIFKETE